VHSSHRHFPIRGGGFSSGKGSVLLCQRRRKKEKKKPRPTSAQKTSVFFSAFAHAVCRHIHLPRMLALTIITESHSPASPLRFVCVCPAQPMTSRPPPPPRGRAVHATLRPNWTCVAAHTFEKHRLCLICRPSSHRTNTAKCSLSRADGRRYRTPLWKALLDTSTGAWAGKTRDGGVLTPAEWPAQPVVSVPSRPASHTTYARAKHQPPPPAPSSHRQPVSQPAASFSTTRHDTTRCVASQPAVQTGRFRGCSPARRETTPASQAWASPVPGPPGTQIPVSPVAPNPPPAYR